MNGHGLAMQPGTQLLIYVTYLCQFGTLGFGLFASHTMNFRMLEDLEPSS